MKKKGTHRHCGRTNSIFGIAVIEKTVFILISTHTVAATATLFISTSTSSIVVWECCRPWTTSSIHFHCRFILNFLPRIKLVFSCFLSTSFLQNIKTYQRLNTRPMSRITLQSITVVGCCSTKAINAATLTEIFTSTKLSTVFRSAFLIV